MIDHWLPLIARSSVLLTTAGICIWLLTRSTPLGNPRWHRWAWGAVLAQGCMLFPLSIQIPVPTWWALHSQSVDESGAAVSEHRHGERQNTAPHVSDVHADWAPLPPVFPSTDLPATGLLDAIPDQWNGVTQTAPATNAALPHDTTANLPSRSHFTSLITLRGTLLTIWASGVLMVLGGFVVNYRKLCRSLSACQPARKIWAMEMQTLCQELGLDHVVHLDVHPTLGPCLCWSPAGYRIVVPVRLWNHLPTEERIAVLHHELCHLRRGDLWKALLARCVVALHWFNPLAWLSARRFDESAEWACDSRMAFESPFRTTQLAHALLSVSQARSESPYLALSVTGGPLFQRVRRLVTGDLTGDSLMKKSVWSALVVTVIVVGAIRPVWKLPSVLAQDVESSLNEEKEATSNTVTETPDASSNESSESNEASNESSVVSGTVEKASAAGNSSALGEYAQRIVVGDNETLRKFVALVATPTGQIVMADRAAISAQEAANEADPTTRWQTFVDKHFDRQGDQWVVRELSADEIQHFVRDVETAVTDIEQISSTFMEIAPEIAGDSEIAPLLQRFLQHDAAPAYVYHTQLRDRLHPGVDQLEERFQEHLVRTRTGSYVIRPTRRNQVEKRMDFIDKLQGPLRRFEKELAAWADDLVNGDDVHDQFAATLRTPEFARFVVFDHISEDSNLSDDELNGLFSTLEEATTDTPTGLKLDVESESYQSIRERMDRFQLVWNHRGTLSESLAELTGEIESSDELHGRLKEFLGSDLALIFVARDMDYLPVEADQAAREWLSQIITKNDSGKYEITTESTEDLKNRLEEFFRESRDVRRRGRVVDEFNHEVSDAALKQALETLVGKLMLSRLIESAQQRPDVDGLALWFEGHFQETPEGLVLNDWANDTITEILREAEEIESELVKQDF